MPHSDALVRAEYQSDRSHLPQSRPVMPRVSTLRSSFDVISRLVPMTRRIVRSGELLFRMGDALDGLGLIHSGSFKSVARTEDGREQIIGLHFRDDWMGIDAIQQGRHEADVVAVELSSVWIVDYVALAAQTSQSVELTQMMHKAMSSALNREREAMLMMGSVSADARVAAFLLLMSNVHTSLGCSGASFVMRLTRAEIGSYLGLALETVSRVLSKLARAGVIRLGASNGKQIDIIDANSLRAQVGNARNPAIRLH